MRLLEIPHPLRITSCPTKLYSIFFYPVGVDSRTLHYHLTKAQVAEDSRREIFQRRTAMPVERAKCVKNGHRYCLRVCNVLAAQCFPLFYLCPYGHHHIAELWRPILSPCFAFYSSSKFCRIVNSCICFIFSRKYRRELKALLK